MNLSDFHAMVLDEVAPGRTQSAARDPQITRAIRQAALWLELNNSFGYMSKVATVTLATNTTYIRFSTATDGILAAGERLRKIDFIRLTATDAVSDESEESQYLRQVSPGDFSHIESALPQHYYLVGDKAYLVETPDEPREVEVGYKTLTAWPTATTSEPAILDKYEQLLLAQTMLQLAPTMRMDAKQISLWKALRDEALRVALIAEDEIEQSTRSERMAFEGLDH